VLTRGEKEPSRPPGVTATQPTPRPEPAPPPEPLAPLAIGITESNPHLIAPGAQPAEFVAWRDRLAALRPRLLRVLVDWRRVQPSPTAGPDWFQPADGCLRGLPPCAAFNGIADQLRAANAAGLQPVVTILNTPDWAASPPGGCEGDAGPRARVPADLEAYRVLVRSLLELGAAEGVALPWWSAWNEPNHPTFLGPQRERCGEASRALTPDAYAELVRAMKAELDAAPGEQRIVLGDVAGFGAPKPDAAGAAEFAAALPADVVCAASVWAQHAYVKVEGELAGDAGGEAGAPGLLRGVEDALDAKRCPGGAMPVWITETGADPGDGRGGCEAMVRTLAAWYDDPRVDAAFQYTFREDTEFRTGLADPRLTEPRPAYAAWSAFAEGGREALAQPAAACAR
jgi:hypothetical protein